MNRKTISIWLTALLIGTIFTVTFMGTVSAMNDNQNLSGLVWRADGTAPPLGNHNFCIWVNHSGVWYRFPETGWAKTQPDVDGNTWYSYTLPDEYSPSSLDVRWDHGDTYRVHVDGSSWDNLDGNCTSNGTGSADDPVPAYDPLNAIDNTLNFTSGGAFSDEQQWDVRTVAPLDLAPTDITAYGKLWADFDPAGIPIPNDTDIDIVFYATNFGLINSSSFQISIYEWTPTGGNGAQVTPPYMHTGLPASGSSLEPTRVWHSPNQPGVFWINITVDSGYTVSEYNEINNFVHVKFVLGPDLIPTNVKVDGQTPVDPIYVGPGEQVVIDSDVKNIGFSETSGLETIDAYYGIISLGEYPIPLLVPDETNGTFTWNWNLPTTAGNYYVFIQVDVHNVTFEGDEDNNIFTLHFFVGPDLTPNNVTVDGSPILLNGVQVSAYHTITPLDIFNISMDIRNVGLTSTGTSTFRVTFANCSANGDWSGNPIDAFYVSGDLPLSTLQKGEIGGDVYHDWQAPGPSAVLTYYINITIDFFDTTSETYEGNNTYILELRMDAPDLIPFTIELQVGGQQVEFIDTIPPYFSPVIQVPTGLGIDVTILITVKNQGGVDADPTNITLYELDGVGGTPIADPFAQPTIVGLMAGGEVTRPALWTNPGIDGFWYINISIDFNGVDDLEGTVLELDEYNNWYTLQIETTPKPVTYFLPDLPRLRNGTNPNVYYIKSTTEIVLTAQGGTPPRYTHYRILLASDSSVVQGWTNYTGQPFFTVPYDEDTYIIEYNTTDSVNAEEPTNSRYVIVDDSPPESTITVGNPQYPQGVPGLNVTSDTIFTLNATDHPLGSNTLDLDNAVGFDLDDKDYSGMFFRIKEGNDWTDWQEGFSFVLDLPLLSFAFDGEYTIEYNATDNLGNKEPTKSIVVYLDNTGPTTAIDIGQPKYPDDANPDNVDYVKSNAPFTLSATDTGCGVDPATYMFFIRNLDTMTPSGWQVGSAFNISNDFFPAFDTEGDGNYEVMFYSSDNLGNAGGLDSIDIYVDDTAPLIAITIDHPKYRANATDIWNITVNTEIKLSATDGSGCGISATEWRIINGTGALIIDWQQYSVRIPLTGLADGEYTIEYRSTDFLGNSRTLSENIYLDNTEPTTTIDVTGPQHPSQPIFNVTWATTFTLTGTDLRPGVNVTWYEIKDEDSSTVVARREYDDTPFTLDDLPDGEYNIYFQSEDFVGNVEEIIKFTVNLDTTGPTTSIDIFSGPAEENPDGSYSVEFDTFFILDADDGTGSGVDYIEYRIGIDDTTWTPWRTYNARFNLSLETHGYWNHTIEFRSYDNLGNPGEPDTLDIYIEGDIVPPRPPVLRLFAQGDNLLLDWDPSPDPDVHHYLIYKSATKTGFDFSTDEWNTLVAIDNPQLGVLAIRTQWNDTGAVPLNDELYYCIRGVDARGNIGSTSNIVGMVKLTFERGYNTFGLPLEPFEEITATDILSGGVFADEDTLYRYDETSQKWVGRPKFLPSGLSDYNLEFGQGYMLHVTGTQAEIVFTGATATSIRYVGGMGDENGFKGNLTAEVSGNTLTLTWTPATETGAAGYNVYRATNRSGANSLTDPSLPVHTGGAGLTGDTFTETITEDDYEYYYLVVALDSDGNEGSSTYSVGVVETTFTQGYTPISFVLEPKVPDASISYYASDMFGSDSNTVYYYDGNAGAWHGHPGFVPENMNTVDVEPGNAYLVYVSDQDVSYAFTGT